ncbi:MAG: phospholipid carrier-dependent glycosyltransferase, partial [Acidobacteria bacterium]
MKGEPPGRAAPSRPFPARAAALAALLFLAAAAPAVGRRDLWAPDEPTYALSAREMIETGVVVAPHLNGELYAEKPPLFLWLIVLASLLTGGPGQAAAVLPSVLAAPLAMLAAARIAWLCDPEGRREPPLLAAAMFAGSYQAFSQATVGQIDMVLCALTGWGFALLLEGSGLSPDRRPRPALVNAAFLAFALATLAKGPVGLLVPLGAFAAGAIAARRPPCLRALVKVGPWVVFAAVVAAWLVPAALWAAASGDPGRRWLSDLLFRQTAVRYLNPWHHRRPFWYLGAALLYDMQPTVLFVIPAMWALRRGDGPKAGRVLLAAGLLFVVAFFSISPGKRDIYLLPAYPLAAALAALDASRRLATGRHGSLRLSAAASGALFAAAAAGALLGLVPAPDPGIRTAIRWLAPAAAVAAAAFLTAARRPSAARLGAGDAAVGAARRLEGSRPFWVLLRRKHLPSL